MTCVVGFESKGGVWLASDSFIGTDTTKDITVGPKWFKLGAMTIGWAGDVRTAQVIEHGTIVRPRKKDELPSRYLVSVVARKIRATLREAGEVYKHSGGTEVADIELLITLNGHLYQMWGDCTILRCSRGMGAIGVGGPYALGALSAMLPLPPTAPSPEAFLTRAMTLTAGLSPSVHGPFYVERA